MANPSTYTTIRLDVANKLLYTKWLRSVNSQEYRSSVLLFYNALLNSASIYWLVDATRMTSPDMPDQKWTADLLGAGLCDTNLEKIAVLLPDDLFLEVVAEKIGDEVVRLCAEQVRIAYFREHTEALNWLHITPNIDDLFRDECVEEQR